MYSLHQNSSSRETVRIYVPPRRLEKHRYGWQLSQCHLCPHWVKMILFCDALFLDCRLEEVESVGKGKKSQFVLLKIDTT